MLATVKAVQERLIALGFNPGPADGVRGRATIAAIIQFQKTHGLVADGLVGPKTYTALFDQIKGQSPVMPTDAPDAAPWRDIALAKKGLHEIRNKGELKDFLAKGKGTIGDPAEIPWCGDFVETCIALALPREILPANPYAAINWMPFGIECAPQPGAILIFWRGTPNGWQGHIGFYVSEDATHYHVLGGNQSNAVTITRIAKDRLRKGGCRWPKTALPPRGRAILADKSGLITTTNEA
jgi:uncharacterized protein (TIGR02594 family)